MGLIISHSPQETFALGMRLAATLRGGEVLGLTGDLDIAGSVAVLGCPSAIIAATGQDRIFDLPASAELELSGLELSGGLVTGEGGGAVRANGSFTGYDITFRNNRSNGGDGANGSSPGGGGVTQRTLNRCGDDDPCAAAHRRAQWRSEGTSAPPAASAAPSATKMHSSAGVIDVALAAAAAVARAASANTRPPASRPSKGAYGSGRQ
jgi:hypothetical protein